jgi:hypothetical protein
LQLHHLNDNIGFDVVLPGAIDTAMGAPVGTLPCVHRADDEARYIIDKVFQGKKQIEPSWFWATASRLSCLLPDQFKMKALTGFLDLFSK